MVDYSAPGWIDKSQDYYHYPIRRSMRFNADGNNAADGAHIRPEGNTGFTTAPTSTKTCSFHVWLKRGRLCHEQGSPMAIYSAATGSSQQNTIAENTLQFNADDKLEFIERTAGSSTITTHRRTKQRFRDIAQWYHIVLIIDTTQSSNISRMQFWINGDLIQSGDMEVAASITQNRDFLINGSFVFQNIGKQAYVTNVGSEFKFFDGYMADIHMFDGRNQAPGFITIREDFDGTDVFRPHLNSAARPNLFNYGTRGFNITFNTGQISEITGNMPANIPLHQVSTNGGSNRADTDCPDTPTNCFAVLNTLLKQSSTGIKARSANLEAYSNGAGPHAIWATMAPSMLRGKWYAEYLCRSSISTSTLSSPLQRVGVVPVGTNFVPSDDFIGGGNGTIGFANNGKFYEFGNVTDSGYGGFTNNDVIGVVIDYETSSNATVKWYKNNSFIKAESLTRRHLTFGVSMGMSQEGIWNFGQDSSFMGNKTHQFKKDANGHGDFRYDPPEHSLALCTANLHPTFFSPRNGHQPREAFEVLDYAGNSQFTRTISLQHNPDLMWFQAAVSSNWAGGSFDRIRSQPDPTVTNNQRTLNFWNDEAQRTSFPSFSGSSTVTYTNATEGFHFIDSAFPSVQLPHDGGSWASLNHAHQGARYEVRYWNAGSPNSFGGTPVANTTGSINTIQLANTEAGFSISKYTGTGSAGTIGHGLTQKPSFFIIKNYENGGRSWVVWHNTQIFNISAMDTNAAQDTTVYASMLNSSQPTDSVIHIGNNNRINQSNRDHICYCWHEVPGFSSFGSYEGSGTNAFREAPFIWTGFKPAFVILKNVDSQESWRGYSDANKFITGNGRGFNPNISSHLLDQGYFQPTQYNTTDNQMYFMSNGFKLVLAAHANSANTYIYAAWATVPFEIANAQ